MEGGRSTTASLHAGAKINDNLTALAGVNHRFGHNPQNISTDVYLGGQYKTNNGSTIFATGSKNGVVNTGANIAITDNLSSTISGVVDTKNGDKMGYIGLNYAFGGAKSTHTANPTLSPAQSYLNDTMNQFNPTSPEVPKFLASQVAEKNYKKISQIVSQTTTNLPQPKPSVTTQNGE
ncbi:hypothetical protein BMT54_10065 [Pasteurellaceae bacterium 15-036681]|nr:hypothetical protein BMT54_10065 [Pasteurellaceae bacterium 15-036681]